MIDISKALAIDGWMRESELIWLAEQAQSHQVIVEIGSFLGKSTRALADNTSGVVYAFDDWYGPRDVPEISESERAHFFDTFSRNIFGVHQRVKPVRGDHADIKIDVSPDMIFIDGDHSYESVRRDIENWMKRAAPKALISGHDALTFKGVNEAVKDLLPEAEVAPYTDIWFTYLP